MPKVTETAPTVPRAETAAEPSSVNVDNGNDHHYALDKPPSPAMEIIVDDTANVSMQGNTSCCDPQFSQPKKVKLSLDLDISDSFLSSSPDLHHKPPSRQHQDKESEDSNANESHVHTY